MFWQSEESERAGTNKYLMSSVCLSMLDLFGLRSTITFLLVLLYYLFGSKEKEEED